MFHRGVRMLRTSAGTLAGAFRVGDWTLNQFDPEGLRSVANVLVWVHWFIVATCFVQLVYRPYYGAERFAVYTLLYLTLVAFTAYAHYRLASGSNITWRWVFALCSLDAALISGGRHYRRRLRPLLLPPVLLPGAGRLCRFLHLLPAEHGLRDGGGGVLPADEPAGGGRH